MVTPNRISQPIACYSPDAMMNPSMCGPVSRSPWRTALVNNGCLQTGAPIVMPRNIFRSEKRHNQTRTRAPAKPLKLRTSPSQQSGKFGKLKSSPMVPNYDYEQNFPPITLLKTAYNSGALPIAPAQVIDFLRDFQTQRQVESPGWKRRVCLSKKQIQVLCRPQTTAYRLSRS